MNSKPIFILGSERSGSNLLRKLLENHKELSAPVSPHFLDAFYPIAPFYANSANNTKDLLEDMISYANHPFNNWQLKSTAEEILATYSPTGLMSAYDAIYSAKAVEDKKIFFVSKDNHVFNHMKLIDRYYGDKARFVYLYRDVRDHTASWMNTPLFLKTPFQVAAKWTGEQKKCIQICETHKAQVFMIKYEDLVSDTSKYMKEIITFLELDWDENCAQTKKENAPEAKGNILWKNLEKPVMSRNFNKYKSELSNREIKIIEGVAGAEMARLGYVLESNGHFSRRGPVFVIEEYLRTRKTNKLSEKLLNGEMKELQDKLNFLQKITSKIIDSFSFYY